MIIVVVSDWFAEKMGYSENVLPKALAKLGAEVHVVTSDLQPLFPDYQEIYEPFLGPYVQPVGTKPIHGFTLHRLPHTTCKGRIFLRGFHRLLADIRPDIVQCFTIPAVSTYQSVLSKYRLGYRLFLEEHTHWSVFSPPKGRKARALGAVYRASIGRLVSAASERCYPIAPDAARIVVKYYGYSRHKVQVCSLGVDTDVFVPIQTEEHRAQRRALREKLGFKDQDIVCVYSGRFTQGKAPLCLAQAVELLHQEDSRYKALFVGSGTPGYVRMIEQHNGSIVHPFVEWERLPGFYRAADIGVWPKQESTSQLDAAACGLPLILSNRVEVTERVDGNGLLYEEGNANDLAAQIRSLSDPATRDRLGGHGVQKIRERFSWDLIAQQRMQDYQDSLENRKSRR